MATPTPPPNKSILTIALALFALAAAGYAAWKAFDDRARIDEMVARHRAMETDLLDYVSGGAEQKKRIEAFAAEIQAVRSTVASAQAAVAAVDRRIDQLSTRIDGLERAGQKQTP